MGTLTLSDLQDELRGHLGNRTDLTTTKLTRALNLTQQRMSRLHKFRELQTTITGIFPYTGVLTTDKFITYASITNRTIDEFISITVFLTDLSQARKLEQWTPRQYDERVPAGELFTTRIPDVYILWNDKLELFPIPDQEYGAYLRLYLKPQPLVNAGDVSDLDEKDDLIIFLTTSYLFGRLGEYDRANQFFSIYKDEFNNAMSDDQDYSDLDIKPRHIGKSVGMVDYWKDPFFHGDR